MGIMYAADLVEVLCACHLSSYVQSPFQERSGLMVVGPPGSLKSTFVTALSPYPGTVVVSDINAKTLGYYRDGMASGQIKTMVLPEMEKLYERHPYTASNIEGTLRALVGEGFRGTSHEDSRMSTFTARAMVIGALTIKSRQSRFVAWEDSGFNRRFLWSLIRLKDADLLEKAAINWELVPFQVSHMPRVPIGGESSIPNHTTVYQRQLLYSWVKDQPGGNHALHVQLLTKVLAVLQWWYLQTSPERDAMETVRRFAFSLGKEGADVVIDLPKVSRQKQTADRLKLEKARLSAAARQLSTKSRVAAAKRGKR